MNCFLFISNLQLVKMYEDYLEEFVFETAKAIAKKLFGSKSSTQSQENTDTQPLLGTVATSRAENLTDEATTESPTAISTTDKSDENGEVVNDGIADKEFEPSVTAAKNDGITEDIKCSTRKKPKKNKSSLNDKIETNTTNDDTMTNSTALVKPNTYELLCSEMSEEIAETEALVEAEANHVATPEGWHQMKLLFFFFTYKTNYS